MAAEYVSVALDPTASGNDASFDASLSGDGRLVAFTSRATDLVPGFADGNGGDGTDVFVRDVATGATTLVSRSAAGAAAGANGSSANAAVSADGRFVAFESAGTDLPAPSGDARTDVFLYEVATGAISLVSRTAAGDTGDGASGRPAVSGDGRFVAFESRAGNLGASGDPGVLVRDVVANTTVLASVWADGSPVPGAEAPSVSDDGQRVVFTTAAVDPGGSLGSGAPDANGGADVYLRDLAASTTRLVSRTPAGAAGDGASDAPAVSGNGRTVVFQSAATDLAGADAGGMVDVFAADVATGVVQLISVNPAGAPGDGESTAPAVSADGLSVAFVSQAADLLDESNNLTDVYVRDLASGQTIVVGGDVDGSVTNGSAVNPAFSADGRWVAFESIGTRLDPDTTESGDASDLDVFLTPRVATAAPPVVTPTEPGPDLTVTAASRDPVTTADGAPVTVDGVPAMAVSAVVANAGDVDAGPFVVRFALSADPVYDDADAELAVVAVPVLAAGATLTVSAGDPPPPAGVANGDYYVVARADAGGAVPESSEANNDAASAAAAVTVTTGAAGNPVPTDPAATDGLPNLVAGALGVKLKSASVVAGSKAPTATFRVTNGGPAAVDVTVAVRVVASADGVVDAGDADVATFEDVRVKLKAGKAKTLKLKLGLFASPPDGSYLLLAQIDSQNVLDESNEADNTGATATAVTIAAPFVDLQPVPAESLGTAPATASPGGKMTFRVTVTNPGNVDLKATTTAALYASADATLGPDDVSLSERPLKLSLKPGKAKMIKLMFTLSDALPTGTAYFFILQLDALNGVVERNEGDNVLVADSSTTTN
jgi:Tol biopolymer transport system component